MMPLALSIAALAVATAALALATVAFTCRRRPPTLEQREAHQRVEAAVQDYERRAARKQPRGAGGKWTVVPKEQLLPHGGNAS